MASNSISENTHLKNSMLENFHHCMEEVGLYLFSQSHETVTQEDLEKRLLHCEFIKDLDQEKKHSNLKTIDDTRKKFATLDTHLKKQCLTLWRRDWDKSKTRQDWLKNGKYDESKLTPIIAELFTVLKPKLI